MSEAAIVEAAIRIIDAMDDIKAGRRSGQGVDLAELRAAVEAHRRAPDEDTPDPGTDGELIAAHDTPTDTPPVCATCGGSRIKPWDALTDDERATWHRTGTSIPCPDCTEDTRSR